MNTVATIKISDLAAYSVDKPCVRIIAYMEFKDLELTESDFCALDDFIRKSFLGNKELPDWFFKVYRYVKEGYSLWDQTDIHLASDLQIDLQQLYLSMINWNPTDFIEITKKDKAFVVFQRVSMSTELCNKLLHVIQTHNVSHLSSLAQEFLSKAADIRRVMLQTFLLDQGKLFSSVEGYNDSITTDTLTFRFSGGAADTVNLVTYYRDDTVSTYGTKAANFGFGYIVRPSCYYSFVPAKCIDSLPGDTDEEKQRLFCEKHHIHCATLGEAVSVPYPVAKTQTVYGFKVGKEKQHD